MNGPSGPGDEACGTEDGGMPTTQLSTIYPSAIMDETDGYAVMLSKCMTDITS